MKQRTTFWVEDGTFLIDYITECIIMNIEQDTQLQSAIIKLSFILNICRSAKKRRTHRK